MLRFDSRGKLDKLGIGLDALNIKTEPKVRIPLGVSKRVCQQASLF
jgi:hypothetical protein